MPLHVDEVHVLEEAMPTTDHDYCYGFEIRKRYLGKDVSNSQQIHAHKNMAKEIGARMHKDFRTSRVM